MNVSEFRLKRIIRIVDMLKKKRYPNATSIVKEFEQSTYDVNESIILSCSPKTVMRDLDILRRQFNCPLAYDRRRHGYFLRDLKWDFAYPAYLSETQMMAMLMGRQISEYIFPEPLKSELTDAVDYLLNVANPDLLKCSFVTQMTLFPAKTGEVDSGVFDSVYRAWRDHQHLFIIYKDPNGHVTEREIEPHGLFFLENSWYVNAFCHKAKDKRMFMIHRMQKAKCMTKTFIPDPKLYDEIMFDADPIQDVVLKFHKSIHDAIFAMPFHERQEIIWDTGNDEFKQIKIPEVSERVLIPRILAAMGKITVLEPYTLKAKIKAAANAVIDAVGD